MTVFNVTNVGARWLCSMLAIWATVLKDISMDPLVITVSKAASVMDAKRAVTDAFMVLSCWGCNVWPVEENVGNVQSNCTANATNCEMERFSERIL